MSDFDTVEHPVDDSVDKSRLPNKTHLSNATHDNLVKTRQRVADHGEVFTPAWMVESMLNLVSDESERIDSRFLEPACGSGNFLSAVLLRKLKSVEIKYGKSAFEKSNHALMAMMCIYGIELLPDNVQECRENLLRIFDDYLGIEAGSPFHDAAIAVLKVNVVQGDALTLTKSNGEHIEFPEWGYLGAGKFQRRDFRYDSLAQRSSIQGTLFELFEENQVFVPTNTFPPMSVEELSK